LFQNILTVNVFQRIYSYVSVVILFYPILKIKMLFLSALLPQQFQKAVLFYYVRFGRKLTGLFSVM